MSARRIVATSVALVASMAAGAPVGAPAIAASVLQVADRAPDYDGDGFDDLAVGIPQESLGDLEQAGAVEIRYGTASGIGDEFQAFNQDTPGVGQFAEANDGFGSSLAWGDFDDDGFDDLVVGVPEEDLPPASAAGVIHVLYGSEEGLTTVGTNLFSAAAHDPTTGARFGGALASGDLNGDGVDDLAVGAPRAPASDVEAAGVVEVLFGTEGSGLSNTDAMAVHQDLPGVPDEAQEGDSFGFALAIGDFGRSARLDLAIGVPGENVESDTEDVTRAGVVYVMYGTAAGPSVVGDQLWSQNSPGVPEASEEGEGFGSLIVAANFGDSPQTDLAISTSRERLGPNTDAGAVTVLYGSGVGLTGAGSQVWHQATPGIPDAPEASDSFGSSLAAGNFGKTSHADLAIGVPGEGIGDPEFEDAGAVHVLYGSPDGLSARGSQLWHQDRPGVEDHAVQQEAFGAALAAGNYGNGPQDDLAIGVPGSVVLGGDGVGVVAILYGRRAGLGATNDEILYELSSIEEGDFFGQVLA